MVDLIVTSALTHSLLLVLPIALAGVLRLLRCPGWSVLGGVVAGVLLGPAALGRVAPQAYERFFVSGAKADSAEVAPAGAPEPHDPMRPRDDPGRWSFQRPFRSYTSAVLVCTCIGAGLLRRRRPAPAPWSDAAAAGLAAAALSATLALGAWALVAPWSWPPALLAAAALACGPVLVPEARPGARVRAGHVAGAIAVPAALAALWAAVGTPAALWGAVLLAIPAAWLVPALPPRASDGAEAAPDSDPSRTIRLAVRHAFTPSLAACATIRVAPETSVAFWALAALLAVIAVAGRWAVLRVAAPRGTAVGAALAACAPTQLAVTAVAMHAWALPGAAGAGLVLGAVALATLERD